MIWLLDVSDLIARLLREHQHESRVAAWWPGRKVAVCPITELGFLRVAANLYLSMEEAREALAEFLIEENPVFIPCDGRALDSAFSTPRQSTDIYLADLAASRGWRFVTLDTRIAHSAVDLIPD